MLEPASGPLRRDVSATTTTMRLLLAPALSLFTIILLGRPAKKHRHVLGALTWTKSDGGAPMSCRFSGDPEFRAVGNSSQSHVVTSEPPPSVRCCETDFAGVLRGETSPRFHPSPSCASQRHGRGAPFARRRSVPDASATRRFANVPEPLSQVLHVRKVYPGQLPLLGGASRGRALLRCPRLFCAERERSRCV